MASFKTETNRGYTQKLRELIKELPPLCAEFFRGVEPNTTALTRYAYAVDLRLFFNFMINELTPFAGRQVTELELDDLEKLRPVHIEMYMEYIGYYTHNEREVVNNARAKARKLSSLRSLFKYFFKKEKLSSNITALVDLPKLHDKPITRLEPDEVAKLLDAVNDGEELSAVQKRYHKSTKLRDSAILTLFLGTGIRISELVGLNCSDINFTLNGFRITRKGGDEVILYFGDEVRAALLKYLGEREQIDPLEGHEDALFLSMQRRRITARAVENLVKKYTASPSVTMKKISPHKLRSTYGTMLYQETGDIYLVADVLGHKDVNTTKKHYAAISDDRRRLAARAVKLRDDDDE